MNEAMLSFLEIIKVVAPYTLSWGLGIKAYRFVTNAMLGKDARI